MQPVNTWWPPTWTGPRISCARPGMTLWTRLDDFCIDIWVSNRWKVYVQQSTSAKLDWAQDQLGQNWDDATPLTGRRDPYFEQESHP